ncbi:MAG: F0F1 ATP synthase subunit delta [Pseudomonadota bacterium]
MAQLTTLARPYARAAFETAVAENKLGIWSKMLGTLGAVVQEQKVASFLREPSHSSAQHADALIDMCGDALSDGAKNFVRVLAANKRLILLGEIVSLFEELKADHERVVDVDVISAFSMDEGAQQKLASALKQRLQRDVKLHTSVDKSLIGGLVVRAGDLVIDGSVRGKLNKLIETMSV